MVADNKQQSDSHSIVASSQPQANPSNKVQGGRGLPALFKSKKKLVLLLVVACIVLVGGAILIKNELHVGDKIYAQAAGHKIYKEDIDNLVGKHKDISNRQAATVLADKYLTEAMAKKAGFTVSDKDIQAAYGSGVVQQKKTNPYNYQFIVNQLYFQKLRNSNEGVYKGDLLVTQFSRYLAYQSPLLPERQAINPKIGNPEAIAADKKYAQDLINSLYNQIKSKKITFDQAVQIEHNDPREGEKAYPTLSHSGPFDTSSSDIRRNALIETAAIQGKVKDMKPSQLSKPFVVRVSNSNTDDSTAESYFLVVKMDSLSGKPSGLTFDQYLAQSKKDLGYKVYA